MDGFTCYATAVEETLPDAVKVMDPFHVVHPPASSRCAGSACSGKLLGAAVGHRTRCTRTGKPCSPDPYLSEKQKQRLDILWATDDDYVALEVTWLFYQDLIHTYHPSWLKLVRTVEDFSIGVMTRPHPFARTY